MKRLFAITFIFLLIFLPSAFPQGVFDKLFTRSSKAESEIDFPTFIPPAAPRTTLSEKKAYTTPSSITHTYYYFSDLSADEIAGFYGDIFSKQGLLFVSKEIIASHTAYIYKRGAVTQAILTISERYPDHYGENSNKTPYIISWEETYNIFALPETAVSAKSRKDMTVYPGAYELRYPEAPNNETMTYLTKSEAERVISYYKDHMGQFGWKLESESPINERSNIYEAAIKQSGIGMAEALAANGISMAAIFPGVEATIKGSAMIYDKGETKCHVMIYQFKDSSQQLRLARINPKPFEKYGRTLIMASIVASPNETLTKLDLPSLKKILDESFGFDQSGMAVKPDMAVQPEDNSRSDSSNQKPANSQFQFSPDVKFIPDDAQFVPNPQQ